MFVNKVVPQNLQIACLRFSINILSWAISLSGYTSFFSSSSFVSIAAKLRIKPSKVMSTYFKLRLHQAV